MERAFQPDHNPDLSSLESRLPARQQWTSKFPVVGEKEPLPEALNLSTWTLTIGGLVSKPLVLSWQEFLQLPQTTMKSDIHCVTRWSKADAVFEGVMFKDIAALVVPKPEARFVQFIAYSQNNHHTSLPLSVCLDEKVMCVHKIDGEPLTVEHGFPLRTFAPTKYFYKGLKWVREIRFLSEDVLGTWERGGYHNNADFTREERYVSGNLKAEQVAHLRRTGDFSRFKGQVLLSIDLSESNFSEKDLKGVQLKNCNLQRINLVGADISNANLTNSDLTGAIIKGVKSMDDTDLDGVLLMGADLRGVSARRCWLNATEFTRPGYPDALVEGLDLSGSHIEGLIPAQLEFLKRNGALI